MRLLTFLSALLLVSSARADGPGLAPYRFGADLGATTLTGEAGRDRATAFAYGLTLGTLISPELGINFDILSSTHPNVSHSEVSLGVDYYFMADQQMLFDPRATAGLARVSNTFKSFDTTGSTFGAFVGIGGDFRFTQGWRPGVELRYTKVIPADTTVFGVGNFKTVEDSASFIVRVLYEFSGFSD